jgi:hypothetical protein
VVDDQDRRLINTYLDALIRQELLPAGAAGEAAAGREGQQQEQAMLELAPGFRPPPPTDYESMRAAIEAFPADSPALYAMHGNAQLSLLNSHTEALFQTLVDVGAAGGAAGRAAAGGGAATSGGAPAGASEAAVRASLADLLGRLPAPLNVVDIEARVKEKTPFVVVALQVGSGWRRRCRWWGPARGLAGWLAAGPGSLPASPVVLLQCSLSLLCIKHQVHCTSYLVCLPCLTLPHTALHCRPCSCLPAGDGAHERAAG